MCSQRMPSCLTLYDTRTTWRRFVRDVRYGVRYGGAAGTPVPDPGHRLRDLLVRHLPQRRGAQPVRLRGHGPGAGRRCVHGRTTCRGVRRGARRGCGAGPLVREGRHVLGQRGPGGGAAPAGAGPRRIPYGHAVRRLRGGRGLGHPVHGHAAQLHPGHGRRGAPHLGQLAHGQRAFDGDGGRVRVVGRGRVLARLHRCLPRGHGHLPRLRPDRPAPSDAHGPGARQ